MFSVSNRRGFLKTLIKGAAGIPLARAAYGQQSAITATRLTENLVQIIGAGGNVVVLHGPDGLLMIDGSLPERSSELLRFLSDEFKNQPVRVAFNTDWHLEHTGSNDGLKKTGAKIIAHENTKLWIGADFFCDWQNRAYKPRPAAAFPTETFYSNGKMTFGNDEIRYGHMPMAHTDGDIYVFLPGQNVLIAGDVLSVGKYPILDYTTGGWIGGLQNAMKTLLDLAKPDTQIVPGVGPVQTRADLQAQSDMLAAMRDRLVRLMRQGMSAKDMIAAAPSKEFDAKWGNPELFISNAYRGMWGHVRELGNII
jgi:cyclase